MTLTLRFWGTRGSIPTPGATTVRYGGNTPCVEVRTPGDALLVLDAGTGIRELGRALLERVNGAPITGDIFLTHGHWDHIQGLPFFLPIFDRGNQFRIWSAAPIASRVDRAVRAQMAPTVFPVPFDELEATVEFRSFDGTHAGPDYVIDAIPVRHPGGALGYRIRATNSPDTGLVYISDNELGATSDSDRNASGWRDRLVAFARGASVLVHDAMYTRREYEAHRGWGHSHYVDALELALDAGVQRLVLFHHNPDHADEEIDRSVAECRTLVRERAACLEVRAAAEGETLVV